MCSPQVHVLLIILNKKEKKLKREQARAQALASKNQSDEIFKMLENMSQVSNQVPDTIGRYLVTLRLWIELPCVNASENTPHPLDQSA